jgi:L-threonylcarbamoyladenylate synthase
MKYRHYAPKGEMAIVEGSPEAVTEKINALAKQAAQAGEKVAVLCKKGRAPLYEAEYVVPAGEGDDLESIARGLYAALRSFDDLGATKIYSESFAPEGDAGSEEAGFYEAVRNRLMKAAGQNVIWAG